MSLLMLSPTLQAQEDSEILHRYFNEQQIDEFRSLQIDANEIASLFAEVGSVEEVDRLLSTSKPAMWLIQKGIQELLLEIVRPGHNDYTNLVNLLHELEETTSNLVDLEYVDFHVGQLDTAHIQRLHLSMQDFDYFQTWALDEIRRSIKEYDLENPKWEAIEWNSVVSTFFFLTIASIIKHPSYKPSLPIIVDSFYISITKLNFIVDEQGAQPDLIIRPAQDLDGLGYRKGRFDGETDEDIDKFIESIRILREQN